jgi:hypothetical protein
MATLNYSKKQIQPLIDKYAINAETNTTFAKIIEMFDGKPNYQLWAVKVVFSKAVTLENLESIQLWAEENSNLIKKLSKGGNIISYSTSDDFKLLMSEMIGLSDIAFVKNIISRFNTDQRKILTEIIKPDEFDGTNCHKNAMFNKWFNLFSKFNKLSGNTKTKVIGRMSAVRNANEIESLLNQALREKYSWNKEDLLSFVANNTPDAEVIFDDGNVVILQVKNYQDSNTLCYGRTSWCITSSESQWKSYVSSKKNKQFFFFDFSKPEKDELAHIGFTISDANGFYAAHSTSDSSLMNSGINYHGKQVNIQQALSQAGVGLGTFLKLRKTSNYKWDETAFVDYVKAHEKDMAVAYREDGKVIVNILSNNGLSMLCSHTFIKCGNMPIDTTSKCYVLFNFNMKENDDKSIVAIYYRKDTYKIDTLNQMWDAYGTNLKDSKYLSSIGISTEMYLNREAVSPNILLHKLIDEGDDEGACALIDKEKDIDVNYVFNDNRPVFRAIESKLHKTVGKIIANKKFDCNVDDGFGESLIQNLLFAFYLDVTAKPNAKNSNNIKEMLNTIIDSGKFDLNFIDDNYDTAINIACCNPNMLWLVEKLASNKDVNINCVNDAGHTAFGEAIRHDNLEALTILGKRPDIELSDKDKKVAKQKGIDVSKYLKPTDSVFKDTAKSKTTEETVVADIEDADKYNEIFKKVFSA